jgi:hypothetical protein
LGDPYPFATSRRQIPSITDYASTSTLKPFVAQRGLPRLSEVGSPSPFNLF